VLRNITGSLMDHALPAPPPNLAADQKQQKFLRDHTEPEELVVISADMAQAQQLAQILGAYGLTPKRRKPLKNLGLVLSLFRVPPDVELQQITLNVRKANPPMWVDHNHRFQLLGDTQSSRTAKDQIAWPAQDNNCGKGLRIGMIDTDLNLEHPALKGQRITSQSMISAGINRPVTDHGTAVASLLIGKPGSAFAGPLPGAQLFNAAVFRAHDSKHTDTTAEWIISAIDWLLEQKVQTINMSLGGPRNLLLDVAIQRSIQSGVIVVAAAGNSGASSPPVYPAAQPGVIAVTAVDSRMKLYRDAAAGDYISFAAPGVDVWAADAQAGNGKYFSGTSFATPFVSAAMATQMAQQNKHAGPRDAYTTLEKSAKDLGKPCKDTQFGWGLVQSQCK
jgi:subtilisin family serine protease